MHFVTQFLSIPINFCLLFYLQAHATEMRHMIGNVAHDLKTVSVWFVILLFGLKSKDNLVCNNVELFFASHVSWSKILLVSLPQPLSAFVSGLELLVAVVDEIQSYVDGVTKVNLGTAMETGSETIRCVVCLVCWVVRCSELCLFAKVDYMI